MAQGTRFLTGAPIRNRFIDFSRMVLNLLQAKRSASSRLRMAHSVYTLRTWTSSVKASSDVSPPMSTVQRRRRRSLELMVIRSIFIKALILNENFWRQVQLLECSRVGPDIIDSLSIVYCVGTENEIFPEK